VGCAGNGYNKQAHWATDYQQRSLPKNRFDPEQLTFLTKTNLYTSEVRARLGPPAFESKLCHVMAYQPKKADTLLIQYDQQNTIIRHHRTILPSKTSLETFAIDWATRQSPQTN
jgi:hypothetical protein